ncbi:MAG TPA: hypothetical protein VK601_14260, partial [Kofleriaceae bacterium]|nr:hypothetical protein [Kofleriaceae bacterium]
TVFSAGSTDIGAFEAIPGTANGVCAAGTPPACTGSFSIGAASQRAITFDWTLTDNDKCSYQIPGAVCSSCVCDHTGATPCDPDPTAPVGKLGTHAAAQPCVKLHFQHQCMYVELSSPNGAVNFEQQSAYRNMDFGPMSVLAREALIDARRLPVENNQTEQDIYLMVMPRNMPGSVPPTTRTVDLVQNQVIDAALRIAQPYNDDLDRMPGDQIPGIAKRLDHPALSVRATDGDERVRKILRARQVMSKADLARVDALLGVAFNQTDSKQPSSAQIHNAVALLGPEVAAEVVPTLDIYPFYLPGAKGHIYQPMTAFTIFLSHEDTLSGVQYQIDGADKVGENVYHLRIPVGNARKIQVRAQALVGNEPKLPVGNPSWPCAGGCAACGGANRSCGLVTVIGNSGPGLLAGVLVIGRRRRRRDAKR